MNCQNVFMYVAFKQLLQVGNSFFAFDTYILPKQDLFKRIVRSTPGHLNINTTYKPPGKGCFAIIINNF